MIAIEAADTFLFIRVLLICKFQMEKIVNIIAHLCARNNIKGESSSSIQNEKNVVKNKIDIFED